MARLNIRQVLKKIENAPKLKGFARSNALSKFNAAHGDLIEEFTSHGISEEVGQGAVTASSNFLERGNLFSFLGFEADRNPVDEVVDLLKEISLDQFNYKTKIEGKTITYTFKVNIPTQKDFATASPMPPYRSGRSWVFQIEKGASGLASYRYSEKFSEGYSRSGTGLQKDGATKGVFKQQYITPILEKFKLRIE